MSLAYPEGECFFKRSALNSSTYDANNPENFYSHFMIEYIWNRPAFHGSKNSNYDRDRHYHPRSIYKSVKGDMWDTHYGNWANIFFLYGKAPHSAVGRYRQAEHNLCISGNRFRDQEKGGSLESWFMVMPMPRLAEGEEWVLIDRTACIRAIYIPVAQQASEDYPDVCTFLQVNFAISREINILTHPEIRNMDGVYDVVDRWETIKLDSTLGLVPAPEWTMAINIRQLVNLLSLPRFLRDSNSFSSQCIRLVDRKVTPTTGPAQKFSDSDDLSWTKVAGANYGLTIQWKPPQATTWLADFLKNTVTIAVGFIPVMGPLAAVAFPLAWSAIVDPNKFEETLRGLVPAADVALLIRDEIQKSVREQQVYLPQGWAPTSRIARESNTATPQISPEEIKEKEAKKEATLQKIESIRKFKYWNVLKPQARTATAETSASSEAVPVKQEVTPPSRNEPPLDELGPSALFQLAGQVLEHSKDDPALKADTVGKEDDQPGGTLEEILP